MPQGTVLGPLLFLVYMNSLLKVKNTGNIISFADDTAVQYYADSWTELEQKAKNDILQLKKWFDYNHLILNLEKTKYLPFASYITGLPTIGPIKITECTEIPEASHIKYLGVKIDRHLRWDEHLKELTRKLRGLLFKIKCLKKHMKSIKHLNMVYYALVQSQLSYGILGWGGAYEHHLKNLVILQKWILKVMHGKPITFSSDELFRISGVLDVRQLYAFKIFTSIFQRKISIKKIEHQYCTRNRDILLESLKCRRRIGQRSCNYLAPKLYSSLPKQLKDIKIYKTFKISIKQWMINGRRNFIADIINRN